MPCLPHSKAIALVIWTTADLLMQYTPICGNTRSAAMELGPRGIRVNCICPGVVDTEMVRNYPALVETLKGIIALEHMAQPEQLADVMFFLLGPQSSYITGADLAVDGGVTGTGIYWPVGRELGVI